LAGALVAEFVALRQRTVPVASQVVRSERERMWIPQRVVDRLVAQPARQVLLGGMLAKIGCPAVMLVSMATLMS